MSKKIQILPEFVANQIAAGEVVEGPSSIIKELFENSVDAKSSKIDISISKNLLKLEIIDDGEGIDREDLGLAFKKHATSKIKSIDDLNHLITNGFRGEALPSIASVSKLTCISRTKDSSVAHKIYIENDIEQISETGSGFGTKIIVDDLFFNTPARLKFLKSDSRERNQIIDCCRGLALANPSIRVSLSIDGKNILKTNGSDKLNQVMEEIFKKDISKQLLKAQASESPIEVSGFCSKLTNTRTDKRGVFSLVNGRFLDCYIIKSAINSVYKELLTKGKFPIVVINVKLPPEDVDVNVHPNKKEVKYRETNKVYRLIQNAIDKALRANAYESHAKIEESNTQIESATSTNDVTQAKLETRHFDKKVDKEFNKSFTPSQNSFQRPSFNPRIQKDEEEIDKLDFNSSKFIARFGSIDIKKVDNADVKTILSAQGNKTKFEYAHKDFKENQAIIFSGEFIGENWMKEKLFDFLSELGDEIFVHEKSKEQKINTHSRPQAKPNKSVLDKIWQRDNYTCVYCAKALLHPSLIKKKLALCSNADELNSHLASFDHHLPASKYSELNVDEENLFAVCQECNIKKSNSLASKTWSPKRTNAWKKGESISIAGLELKKPELN